MAITQDQKFTNNATTTVPGTISNVATSITVSTGTGDLFPTLSGAEFFIATIVNTVVSDPGYGQLEIVRVTARSADVMTVTRAQEGTTAKSFPAGCVFELRPTAGGFNEIYTKMIAGDALQAPLNSPVFTGNPTAPTPTLGDDDTSIATTAFVRDAFEAYGDRHVNMITNPHASIFQESGAAVTTNDAYFADQWYASFVAAGGAFQAGASTGLGVSNFDIYGMFYKTTTAKGSLAAGDFAILQQPIEGLYTRRLFYGGSSAKGSWLRFRAVCTQSATCSLAVRNGATNRSFVQSFAVTTTPTDYAIFVPGDTTGTWPTDNTLAARVTFCFASGTTFQTATLGAWQAGNFIAANTQTNLLGTLNAQLNISDVQWTDSPILLPFQSIDYTSELLRCQRYYHRIADATPALALGIMGQCIATTVALVTIRHPVVMRVAPTLVEASGLGVTNSTAGVINVTGRALNNSFTQGASINLTVAGGLVAGNATLVTGTGALGFSARM